MSKLKKITLIISLLIGIILPTSLVYSADDLGKKYGLDPNKAYTQRALDVGDSIKLNADNIYYGRNLLCAEEAQYIYPSKWYETYEEIKK